MSGLAEFGLDGRVVWVTGAGKGLGRAIASAVADAGATVVATARTADDLQKLAAEKAPGRIDVAPGSVSDAATVTALVEGVLSRHGRLDGLVNCAGVSPSFSRTEHVTDEIWDQVIAVNLTGTFLCARAAGRAMLGRGAGSIVNITSVHAHTGSARIAPYAASKGGISALTKSLAVEWADRGVRVNSLAPGYFRTDLSSGLLDSKHGDGIVAKTPMARTGMPSELGPAAVFLLSDASSFVTGTTLSVDGGWQAW